MELTKTQKAAKAQIEKDRYRLICRVKGCSSSNDPTYVESRINISDILTTITYMESYIKNYGLEEMLFADIIENLYNTLMDSGRNDDAAILAKKYGL